MKVFFDTNVAVDFLLKREAFFQDAKKVIALCINRQYPIVLSAVSFANISYIARKGSEGYSVNELLILLREMFEVSPSDCNTIDQALSVNPRDFEDAMQYYSALAVHADCIITRNVRDFEHSAIPVLSPFEFLERFV